MIRPLMVLAAVLSNAAAAPDFGPHVLIADPKREGLRAQLDALFRKQERAQFGDGRHAVFFKPGDYSLDFQIGFYTQVAGLGKTPGAVRITGNVGTDAAWMKYNATCNFWRTLENLTITPTAANRTMMWAVSQAAPFRRVHVRGDLALSSGGWSSGGFLADSQVDGTIRAGSQQQWFSRNSNWNEWTGGLWNMVSLGCPAAFEDDWQQRPHTAIPTTPPVREKPWLFVDDEDRWFVMVPPLREDGSRGPSWENGKFPGNPVPLERFHIARPELDDTASLNKALTDGKHLLFTPGIYQLTGSVHVRRRDTILLGIGHATLVSHQGRPPVVVEADEDVIIAGLTFDAGPQPSETLLRIGEPGKRAGSARHPVTLHDIFCRVGGRTAGATGRMVEIHMDHVIGDHLWLWRADHGKGVGWTLNPNPTGLLVEGRHVTLYGLFVEHSQAHQTIWNGEHGRMFFYQCELPYDPPSQEQWRDGTKNGFSAYKVGDAVTHHEAWGLGVYHVFKDAPVVLDNAIETPSAPGIRMRRMVTKRLFGGQPGSGIRHVINGMGGDVITGDKVALDGIAEPGSATPAR